MSRIDDAFTRLNGDGEPPKPALSGFVSEDKSQARPVVPPMPPVVRTPRPQPPPAAPIAKPALESKARASIARPARAQVAHFVGFGWRALLRHKLLIVVAFVIAFATTVGIALIVPKSYEVEVKLLALKSGMMASVSNPGRTIPWDADAPTRAAAEMILRRDNLVSLIRQTDLVSEWDRQRAPILRFADRVKAMVRRREQTPDEKLDAIIAQLERRLVVDVSPGVEGTVTISIKWPDPSMAYMLVERAQRAFLDARQVAETQAIAEAITILERYTQSLNRDINRTLEELSRTRTAVPADLRRASDLVDRASDFVRSMPSTDLVGSIVPAAAEPAIDPGALLAPRLDRLKGQINAKRGELQRLEEEQKQQIDTLQAQLNVARTIYTPGHPTVQTLQQNLRYAQQNSPRVVALRRDLEDIETAYDEESAAEAERLIQAELNRRNAARPASTPPSVPKRIVLRPPPERVAPTRRDELAEFSTLRLRTELGQLQTILERTDSARIELAVSRTAFKYRYSVVTPAEEPGDPTFPDLRAIFVAGFLGSVLFALIAAIGADVLSTRILEPWQVQWRLGLPLLGTVRLS
jgi:hypothetical protein